MDADGDDDEDKAAAIKFKIIIIIIIREQKNPKKINKCFEIWWKFRKGETWKTQKIRQGASEGERRRWRWVRF